MKLSGFKILNIKSIKDTGWCYLSEKDNITIFAGQNEAGKSAILEGLNFFRNGATEDFERLSKRTDSTHPFVECEFQLDNEGWQGDPDIINILSKISSIKLYRGDVTKDDYSQIKLSQELIDIIDIEVEKLIQRNLEEDDEELSSNKPETEKKDVEIDKVEPVPSPEPELDPLTLKNTIHQHLLNHLPTFIYYDSFINILPGTVELSKIDVYPAIQDLQKVFDINFSEVVGKDPRARGSVEYMLNKNATVDLNSYWKQRQTTADDDIYTYDIKVLPNTTDPKLSVVEFMVHRNDGMPLYIEQKSKGFQWFSSFNLRLKALGVDLNKSQKYVILIDEPGQGLHETAQADVKSVLEELSEKGMQIAYTTHNPCLIGVLDEEFLRIRLVSQTRDVGTKIQNIAQYSSSEGSQDALSPIITAMGINSIGQLLDRTIPCVALEGITDHYYFTAMKKVLNVEENYSFIPAVGVNNIKSLISVLIGWGTKFKAVFDDGAGKRIYSDISKYLYGQDDAETKKHVKKMDGFSGIEDLFSKEDFDTYVLNEVRPNHTASNSEYLKTTNKKKELLARLFLEKVNSDPKSVILSTDTKKNFQVVFDWLKTD